MKSDEPYGSSLQAVEKASLKEGAFACRYRFFDSLSKFYMGQDLFLRAKMENYYKYEAKLMEYTQKIG